MMSDAVDEQLDNSALLHLRKYVVMRPLLTTVAYNSYIVVACSCLFISLSVAHKHRDLFMIPLEVGCSTPKCTLDRWKMLHGCI